jgi:D-glycero-alpha-D-manno-heptose-7-phosphate kinase
MKISAKVPTRIDLAGGTLDVYPLYLFEGGGLTVNAAISIYGYVTIEERDDAEIHIRSEDSGEEERYADPADMEKHIDGGLDLVKKALRFYKPKRGLNIALHSEAPRGSGLGGSSALLMALSSALNELLGLGLSKSRIIDLGANIEAQVIDIPTGKQDYFPPLFGGICSIWFDVDGHRLERLDEGAAGAGDILDRLNERLILSFTNINRFSGVTNWAMLKHYIEREGDTVEHMGRIKAVAQAMRQSLSEANLDEFARLLAVEWQNRKVLAEGVTTPEVDAMIAAAERKGARASKLCGAGGGGCMITYAEPEDVPAVKAALVNAGATLMPFQIVPQGIELDKT